MPEGIKLSRRALLKRAAVTIALPPLEVMFNSSGTAYAAPGGAARTAPAAPESRFVLWFNGNGVTERYWIPRQTGANYDMTPCLAPLAPFRDDIHIITGLDNPAARMPGPGNDHHRSMSALVSARARLGRLGVATDPSSPRQITRQMRPCALSREG